MSIELWVEGVIVKFLDGIPFDRAIIRRVGKKEIVVANIENGATSRLDKVDLNKQHELGAVTFLAESRDHGELKFFDLTAIEQQETNRKYKYIKRLQEKNIYKVTSKSSASTIREVALELDEAPPHWQTVRGWNKSFVDAGRKMRGLYPKHRFKGSREPKIDIRVLEIINKEAKRYFSPSNPSMASIFRDVEDKIIEHNLDNPGDPLEAPTYLTVQNRVMSGRYKDKQKARRGSDAFDAETAGATSGIVTTRVLERVEIDHTSVDLHVLHDDHKTLLGTPYITVLIDHYSHMVLGFQLSFENPSFASVCIACINAFLPKDSYLEDVEVDTYWPAHGIPSTIVTDNGNEFWGKNFISVADEVGSIFQYCKIRQGNYKSRVERFFGIMKSWVLDDLPGVVRKRDDCADGYDARQEATLTYTEFKRHFVTWLTEVFHRLPIEDLDNLTPREIWSASEEEFQVPIEDERELVPILMATCTRELRRCGVRIFNMDYGSPILKDIYCRDGPVSLTVKYNPFDIGYILVLDAVNKAYIKVYCDEYAYASGLSLYEHKQIKKEARRVKKSKLNNLDLQKARVKLAKERDEFHARNARRKTQVTASKAARSEKIGVNEIKLVVDNSKKIIEANYDAEEELNLEGWSIE